MSNNLDQDLSLAQDQGRRQFLASALKWTLAVAVGQLVFTSCDGDDDYEKDLEDSRDYWNNPGKTGRGNPGDRKM